MAIRDFTKLYRAKIEGCKKWQSTIRKRSKPSGKPTGKNIRLSRRAPISPSPSITAWTCSRTRVAQASMWATPKVTPPPTSFAATSAAAVSTCSTRWVGTLSVSLPNSTLSRPVRTRPLPPRRTATISAARSSALASATTGTRKSTPPTRSITSGRSGFSSAFTAPGSMKTSRRAAPSKNSRFLPMSKQRARKKSASTRIRSASLTTPTLRCGGASTARLFVQTKKS